jgi:glycosyltransferase involved in cell wall biosynthesis
MKPEVTYNMIQPPRRINWPTISVITPNLNQGRFLERAITSVLSQGYPQLQYIVIDGGSTDESVAIIRRHERSLAKWVSEPDKGQADALKKGFSLATGELFAWLNADDSYLPGALKKVAEAFVSSGGNSTLVGGGRMADTQGHILFERWPATLNTETILRWKDWFMQAAVFFPSASYQQVGGLTEGLVYAFDFDLWIRLSRVASFHKIDDLLAEHTRHPDSKTEAQRGRSFAETRLVQIRHGGERDALEAIARLHDRCGELERASRKCLANCIRQFILRLQRMRRRLPDQGAPRPTARQSQATR